MEFVPQLSIRPYSTRPKNARLINGNFLCFAFGFKPCHKKVNSCRCRIFKGQVLPGRWLFLFRALYCECDVHKVKILVWKFGTRFSCGFVKEEVYIPQLFKGQSLFWITKTKVVFWEAKILS